MKESDKKVPPGNPSGNAPADSRSASAPDSPVAARADEQIRMRAYEIYRERGQRVGDDMSDWLRAEREYLEHSGSGQSARNSAAPRATEDVDASECR
jgi:hypothetical protein